MHIETEIQMILEAFRQRMIQLINAKRPGDYATLTLPELYAIASKRVADLHQDEQLSDLYLELGRIDSGFDEHGNVELLGVNAWIDAGMSPIIYFSSQFKGMRAPVSFLEKIGGKCVIFPERQALLGNLSLAQFSRFLADRMSFATLTYYWLCQLIDRVPELIAPQNWHHLKTGPNKIDKQFRIKKGQPLQALVPLLLIANGQDASLYAEAKRRLNLDKVQTPQWVVNQALFNAIDEPGMAVLDRYLQAEFGGWCESAVDDVLRPFIYNFSFRSHRTCGDQLGEYEQLWVQKAFDQVKLPSAAILIWPAMVYAKFLMDCCDPDTGEGHENLAHLISRLPAFSDIQAYSLAPGFPLISALISLDEFCLLVHPALIAQLDGVNRELYIKTASDRVADRAFMLLKKDPYFELKHEGCDPACLAVMSRLAVETFNHRGLDASNRRQKSILRLMSVSFKGSEQKDQAIQWCAKIRNQKTRLEAMQLLGLSVNDVSLAPNLLDEFLSRDLGL